MKKTLLTAALFCVSLISNAQCDPVINFFQDFENFTNGVLPQNCWTGSGSPKLSVATVSGNKVLQAYSFTSPTVPFYIVSPEITAIRGTHELSFTAIPATGSAPGNMTIQIGTLATATDFGSFQAVGSPITVSSSVTNFNILIPVSATHKFVAFKIIADGNHVASTIDNIAYQTNLSVGESQLNTFKVYPNPSADKKITISYTNSNLTNSTNSVAIYNLAGAKVFETQIDSNLDENTLNLSALSGGVYIMKLQSGDHSATKKLVLQ